MKKVLLKSSIIQWILGGLVAFYLVLVRCTCRFHVHGVDALPDSIRNSPIIIAFWHSRIAMAPFGQRFLPQPVSMMISRHQDGQIIGKAVWFFGIRSLFFNAGSSEKRLVLKRVFDRIKQGHSIGITPDGPMGPACQAKSGIFFTSLVSQCPVVALSFATTRRVRCASWDRFFIPLPFGQCHLVISSMIPAPQHRDNEVDFLRRVNDTLNLATQHANTLAGLSDKD